MKLIILTLLVLSLGVNFGQVNFDFFIKTKGTEVSNSNFSPDGERFLVSNNNLLSLYYPGTTSLQKQIKTSFATINKFDFLDKNKVAVWGYNSLGVPSAYYEIWNVDEMKLIRKIQSDKLKNIEVVAVINGSSFQGIVSQGVLYLNEFQNNKDSIYKPSINSLGINSISVDKRNKLIYLAKEDGVVDVFNIVSNKIDTSFTISKSKLVRIKTSLSGKFVAVSDSKGNISIIKKEKTFTVNKLLKEHNNFVFNLSFSLDEKYLATSDSKYFYVWEYEKNIFSYKSKIRKSGSITSVSFDPKGKFLVTTGYNSPKVRFWNCQGLNINPYIEMKDDDDKTPPQIMVTNPSAASDKVTVSTEDIKLKGLAIDDRGLFSVMVNGKKVTTSSSGEFEFDLKLSIGENQIRIEATDINNNIAVKKLNIIRRDFDESDFSLEVNNHLLVIAIDKYTSWPQLNNAYSDAMKFKDVLANNYNFKPENIVMVNDTFASRKGIIDGFRKIIENSKANDNIIIYYSGHGYFDPTLGEGYWIPYNAQKGNDGDYLPNSFILQLIKKVESKHVFLVADACFSGSLFNEAHRGYSENVSQYKSRWGLASGRLEYVSDGEAGTQSPFNKYIVKYLTDNSGREFSVSELIQYVKINVANETDQAPIGNPLRNTGDEGGELIFKR
jgi:hypothetical protein